MDEISASVASSTALVDASCEDDALPREKGAGCSAADATPGSLRSCAVNAPQLRVDEATAIRTGSAPDTIFIDMYLLGGIEVLCVLLLALGLAFED